MKRLLYILVVLLAVTQLSFAQTKLDLAGATITDNSANNITSLTDEQAAASNTAPPGNSPATSTAWQPKVASGWVKYDLGSSYTDITFYYFTTNDGTDIDVYSSTDDVTYTLQGTASPNDNWTSFGTFTARYIKLISQLGGWTPNKAYEIAAYGSAGGGDVTAPENITDGSEQSDDETEVTLQWTAPSEDGGSGGASASYELQWHTSSFTWDAGSGTLVPTAPDAEGDTDTYTHTGRSPGTTYYYQIRASDEIPNEASGATEFTASTDANSAPSVVADLAAGSPSGTTIDLTWTAPGDDAGVGTATTYDIRYSTSTINDGNWASATTVSGEDAPSIASTSESFTVTGLSVSTTYYFAVKTSDEVPNTSTISNIPNATTTADGTAPDAVTDLAEVDMTETSLEVTWTAPGDDGATGTATSYDIRYSTSAINAGNWGSATAVAGEPVPSVAGSTETYEITGLSEKTYYYVAMKTKDDVGNESTISNCPQVHTVKMYKTVAGSDQAWAGWDKDFDTAEPGSFDTLDAIVINHAATFTGDLENTYTRYFINEDLTVTADFSIRDDMNGFSSYLALGKNLDVTGAADTFAVQASEFVNYGTITVSNLTLSGKSRNLTGIINEGTVIVNNDFYSTAKVSNYYTQTGSGSPTTTVSGDVKFDAGSNSDGPQATNLNILKGTFVAESATIKVNLTIAVGATMTVNDSLEFYASSTTADIDGTLSADILRVGWITDDLICGDGTISYNTISKRWDSVTPSNGYYQGNYDGGSSDALCGDLTMVLPVILAEFSLQINTQSIDLYWTTVSEEDFDYFAIEKSIDGSTFETIGHVSGEGGLESITDYDFVDENPVAGYQYYRLRAVDIDGSEEIFETIAVLFDNTPNPVLAYCHGDCAAELVLEITVPDVFESPVRIFDMRGNVVYAGVVSTGQNELIFTQPLSNGLYVINNRIESVSYQTKWVVVN